ncbi:MAG: serine/threonine-protein kinase [Pseudoxanthomonas sp.]
MISGGTPGGDEPTLLLQTTSTDAPATAEDALPPGARLGRYRIAALIGSGGMGQVYRAEQLEPVRRTVALKLLRGHRLQARHLAHFEIERQLLAQMQHPGIAQIFDAGASDDGSPYFAMEFIEGSPVTDYCRDRALPLRERIALFVRICEAVQHAHQRGVIHRDLKPGNILVAEVDGRPLPKVIDFGIATAARLQEGAAELAGTPVYMSPEQSRGDVAAIDTRSDVYSLGVVLHELLAGVRPDGASGPAAPSSRLTTLRGDEAERQAASLGMGVRAARRVLRGELDWVVRKAMDVERANRYPTAIDLARDLQRFLDGDPVQAVPAGRAYVWGKFMRRHRVAIAAAAVVVLALVAGVAASLHGLMQAREQRRVAERRSGELKKVVDFQQSMLESLDMQTLGARMGEELERQVGATAPERLEPFRAALARVDTTDVARGLVDYGLLSGAETALERDFADDPQLAAELRESVARVEAALGLDAKATQAFARVADQRAATLGEAAPETLRARRAQVAALVAVADYAAAEAVLRRSLPQAGRLPANDATRVGLELAQAEIVAARGDLRAARTLRQRLLDGLVARYGENDLAVAAARSALSASQRSLGDIDEAAANMEKVVETRKALLGPQHNDTLEAQRSLAVLRMQAQRKVEAVALQEQLVQTIIARYGNEHPRSLAARATLGAMYADSGRAEEALPLLESVLEARERVLGREHPETVRTRLNLATTHARLHDYLGALPLEQQVIEARSRRLGDRHPDTLSIVINHASTLRWAGRYDDALKLLHDVRPLAREALGEKHGQYRGIFSVRADALMKLGRIAEGQAAYREYVELCRRTLGERHPVTLRAVWELVSANQRAGRQDEAEFWRRRYLAPLLAADPKTLDEPLANLAEAIRSGRDPNAG